MNTRQMSATFYGVLTAERWEELQMPMHCARIWPSHASPRPLSTLVHCAHISPPHASPHTLSIRGHAPPIATECGGTTEWLVGLPFDKARHKLKCDLAPWIELDYAVDRDHDDDFDFVSGHWIVEEACAHPYWKISQPGFLYEPTTNEACDFEPGYRQWWLMVNPAERHAWEPLVDHFLGIGRARPMCSGALDVQVLGETMTAFVYNVRPSWFDIQAGRSMAPTTMRRPLAS